MLQGRGRETSLAGVGFEVRAGEVLAIVGAPADGLNLLHEMLLSQRAPARGSIHFLGKEMADTDRRQRVEAGMSFVNPPHARDQSLPHFTVEENLALGQTRRPPFSKSGWLKLDSIRGNAVRSLTGGGISFRGGRFFFFLSMLSRSICRFLSNVTFSMRFVSASFSVNSSCRTTP